MDNYKLIIDNTKGLNLSQEQIESLLIYANELEIWNKTYNLTAIKGVDSIINRHIFDSLSVVSKLKDNNIKRIADIGCGAGLPGIILAIAITELEVYLVESVEKKCRFLRHIIQKLNLSNRIFVISERVEKYQPNFYFEGIICRAFSSLETFVNITAHLGDKDSLWMAMKSEHTKDEELLIGKTNFEVKQNIKLVVESTDAKRHLILLKKQCI